MEDMGCVEVRRYTDGRDMPYEIWNGIYIKAFYSDNTLPDVIKMAMVVIDNNEDANTDPHIRKRPTYLNNVGWREYTEDMPDYDVYYVALTDEEFTRL